jgi:hypothetical protein
MPRRSIWVLLVWTYSELTGLLCLRMPVENIATVHEMDDELVACYALLVFWQPELYKLEESLPSFWSFHS